MPGTPSYCAVHDQPYAEHCIMCMEEKLARGGATTTDETWSRIEINPRSNLQMAQLLHTLEQIKVEVLTAKAKWPGFNSAHEGYAILLEEVDELWEHVRTHQKNRNLAAMRMEAVQVAAMALRFATEVCDEERGRK